MTERRTEVVSCRLTKTEHAKLVADAKTLGVTIADVVRAAAAERACTVVPDGPGELHLYPGAQAWVQARAGRLIAVGHPAAPFVATLAITPRGARALAADLLAAADIAEQTNPGDEAYDAEHGAA